MLQNRGNEQDRQNEFGESFICIVCEIFQTQDDCEGEAVYEINYVPREIFPPSHVVQHHRHAHVHLCESEQDVEWDYHV